jgi:hypothetical protein
MDYRIHGYGVQGRSRQPLLDACRAIKRMGGLTGDRQIGLYREGRDKPDAICGLDWGAAHTVLETRTTGPRFAKWRALPDKLAASKEMAAV